MNEPTRTAPPTSPTSLSRLSSATSTLCPSRQYHRPHCDHTTRRDTTVGGDHKTETEETTCCHCGRVKRVESFYRKVAETGHGKYAPRQNWELVDRRER